MIKKVERHSTELEKVFENRVYDKGVVFIGLHIPGVASGKEPAWQCKRPKSRGFDPWVRKIPWRRKWQPTSVFLPGKSPGQRGPVGYSPESQRAGHN